MRGRVDATALARASRAASVAVVAFGGVVLLGWVFEIGPLKSTGPGFPTTKANTAVAFVLAGAALWLLHRPDVGRGARRLGLACAALSALIGGATLSEYVFHLDLGIDQLLFRDEGANSGKPFPGRMSPTAALNFILLGVAFASLDTESRYSRKLSSTCTLSAILFSLVAVASYVYGVDSPGAPGAYNQIALTTSLAFLVLCAGILCARPDRGPMVMATSQNLGGVMVRRLVPACLVVPLVVGWLHLQGQRLGLYGTEFGVALFALGNVVTLTIVVLWNGRLLERADRDREHARQALHEANAQLERRVQERTGELGTALEALQQGERRLRDIFDNMQDTYFRTDLDGTIRAISPSVRQYGYEVGELIGRDVGTLYADPLDQDRIRAVLQNRGAVTDYELAMLCKDGTPVVISASSRLLFDQNGQPIGYEGILRDISERKRAEETFRGLLEAAPDAMVIVNRGGQITIVNSQTERLLGYTREELLGQPVEIVIPQRYHAQHRQVRKDYFDLPRVRAMGEGRDLHARCKDGREVSVEISLSPLKTEDGTLVSASIRDITAHRLLEQQRADFVAMLTHDIGNPLAAIAGYTSIALETEGVPIPVLELLSAIEASTQTLLLLVTNYLQYARIEAGDVALSREPVILDELLQRVCHVWQFECARRGVHLELKSARKLPAVSGDRVALERIVTNLVQNALKFTPQGGAVTVEAGEEEGGVVMISVSDTGAGIAAQDLQELWGRFRQTPTGRARGGMGLGLFIVKTLVEAHGGTVRLASTQGVGSRFTVTLPAVLDG